MSDIDKDLHACFLAVLLLQDGGIPVTGEAMKKILEATNNGDIQLVYCNIVAKFLEGKQVTEMLTQAHKNPIEVDLELDKDSWSIVPSCCECGGECPSPCERVFCYPSDDDDGDMLCGFILFD